MDAFPNSWENLKKFCKMVIATAKVEESNNEAFFTDNLNESMTKVEQENEADDIILFTGNKQKITGIGGEMLGSLLLDCGCSANVAGEGWWNSYRASLSPELQKKVEVYTSNGKKFRLGGGEELPSIMNVKFPCKLADEDVMFKSNMVKSNIPLLWSKPAMAWGAPSWTYLKTGPGY